MKQTKTIYASFLGVSEGMVCPFWMDSLELAQFDQKKENNPGEPENIKSLTFESDSEVTIKETVLNKHSYFFKEYVSYWMGSLPNCDKTMKLLLEYVDKFLDNKIDYKVDVKIGKVIYNHEGVNILEYNVYFDDIFMQWVPINEGTSEQEIIDIIYETFKQIKEEIELNKR